MKHSVSNRILTLALSFAFVLTISMIPAYAEEFSVRNGVKFGMNLQEISAIEEANGEEVTWPDNSTSFGGDVFYHVFPDNLGGFSGYDYVNGKSKKPEIDYCFKDDSLFRIIYRWESLCADHSDLNTAQQFEDITKAMEAKYELISENTNTEVGIIDFGCTIPSYLSYAANGDYECNLHTFKQYLAKTEDGYVDIWVYHFTRGTFAAGKVLDYIITEYTNLGAEQVENKLDELQSNIDLHKNDL